MSPEQQRQQRQLAFAASGQELAVGQETDCPIAVDQLSATDGSQAYVRRVLTGGLTAEVYQVEADGRLWTLKRARQPCRVQNVDGQTSFLNEIQRRADIQRLKAQGAGAEGFQALVDTRYASYRHGILLSPWIDGEPVRDWDERRLLQLFDALHGLLLNGLFEWDLCPGNILDDGQIRLFDFGYMYRFDPRHDFNSNARLTPQYHAAERFETRHYFAHLLALEHQCERRALTAFELEKRIALQAYQHLRQTLAQHGASHQVLDWLDAIIQRWRGALRDGLDGLYLQEAWRSHWLDLHDDLSGQTCTPLTLDRIDWLEHSLRERRAELQRLQVLAPLGQMAEQRTLAEQLREARHRAVLWQVDKD